MVVTVDYFHGGFSLILEIYISRANEYLLHWFGIYTPFLLLRLKKRPSSSRERSRRLFPFFVVECSGENIIHARSRPGVFPRSMTSPAQSIATGHPPRPEPDRLGDQRRPLRMRMRSVWERRDARRKLAMALLPGDGSSRQLDGNRIVGSERRWSCMFGICHDVGKRPRASYLNWRSRLKFARRRIWRKPTDNHNILRGMDFANSRTWTTRGVLLAHVR
jgi:hypothetical protein